jgi:hypothetical protein
MQKAEKVIRLHKPVVVLQLIVILLSILSTGACGVKSYPFLAPPEDSSIYEPLENDKLFKFFNYTGNNTNYFLGYEIYYKFYSADPAVSDYESELELIELTPTREKLLSLGYSRLYNKLDVYAKPLIPFTEELAEQAIAVEIDFRFLTESIYPEISYSEISIEAARYVRDADDVQDNIYNFYKDNVSSEYSDIPSSICSADTETLYVSLFVLSYGKYEVFNELYSKAASLGKITLQTKNALF